MVRDESRNIESTKRQKNKYVCDKVEKQMCEPVHVVFMPKSLWCSRATSAYIYVFDRGDSAFLANFSK